MKRRLAIDPGTATGWAFRDGTKVKSGSFDYSHLKVGGKLDYSAIHAKTYHKMHRLMDLLKPEIIGIERAFFNSALSEYMFGFQNIVGMIAHMRGIEVKKVQNKVAKKFITGNGGASKEDVIMAVKALGFNPRTEHEADAIAILKYFESGDTNGKNAIH